MLPAGSVTHLSPSLSEAFEPDLATRARQRCRGTARPAPLPLIRGMIHFTHTHKKNSVCFAEQLLLMWRSPLRPVPSGRYCSGGWWRPQGELLALSGCTLDLPSFIALVNQSRSIVRLGSAVAAGPLTNRLALLSLLSLLPLTCGPLSGTSCGGRGKWASRSSTQEHVCPHALHLFFNFLHRICANSELLPTPNPPDSIYPPVKVIWKQTSKLKKKSFDGELLSFNSLTGCILRRVAVLFILS